LSSLSFSHFNLLLQTASLVQWLSCSSVIDRGFELQLCQTKD